MVINDKKKRHQEFKARAIAAREKCSQLGINYCVRIVKDNPDLGGVKNRSLIFRVAHGKTVDQRITLLLEGLVRINLQKEVNTFKEPATDHLLHKVESA